MHELHPVGGGGWGVSCAPQLTRDWNQQPTRAQGARPGEMLQRRDLGRGGGVKRGGMRLHTFRLGGGGGKYPFRRGGGCTGTGHAPALCIVHGVKLLRARRQKGVFTTV
jgi:hypothetical protein